MNITQKSHSNNTTYENFPYEHNLSFQSLLQVFANFPLNNSESSSLLYFHTSEELSLLTSIGVADESKSEP